MPAVIEMHVRGGGDDKPLFVVYVCNLFFVEILIAVLYFLEACLNMELGVPGGRQTDDLSRSKATERGGL